MKTTCIIFFYSILAICFQSCCKEDIKKPISLGEIKVDLDASESNVRTKETLIGNMICDAVKSDAESKGKAVSFAVMNGGGIRWYEWRNQMV